jgi:hypothetical protein
MCANAPKHHTVKYMDLERISHGMYKLKKGGKAMNNNEKKLESSLTKFREFIVIIAGFSGLFVGVSYFFGILTLANRANQIGFGTRFTQSIENSELVLVYGFSLTLYWLLILIILLIVFGTLLTFILRLEFLRKFLDRKDMQILTNSKTFTYFVRIPILIFVILSFGFVSMIYTYSKFDLFSYNSLSGSKFGYHEVQVIEPNIRFDKPVYFYWADNNNYYLFSEIDSSSCKPLNLFHVNRDDISIIQFMPLDNKLLTENCSLK